ncbi:potassium channel subfamily U member 1-like, partial [Carlito syrichta]|uniref:BK channel n=1 Tax=Carlito syrichta TaxID=1868482 RepID=A0A3Q0EBY0_CARSF
MGKFSCTAEIQAAFILSSFVTFLGGLIILFISRLTWRSVEIWKNTKGMRNILSLFLLDTTSYNCLNKLHLHGAFRDRVQMLLSAQTFEGKVLGILVFVLSIGSLIIYFINSTDPVRSCSSYEDKTIIIDLVFNSFFSFYFGLRFVAADDKLKFWLELNSIVDMFTIPPVFISYYLKSNWLGLRFLRALRLLELPLILQILGIMKTSNSVKFSKLLSIILSTWFTAAGFIHLILFANYIPEMVELFANKKKYTSSYEMAKGKKFIVVCGNITVDSVTAFLRNFLRHKSGEINTEIVFLG